ncbi:MAG TPA: hypothetical protein VGH33_12750 [Isosphaeraceae bacterium]|jgi:hypothetical protein
MDTPETRPDTDGAFIAFMLAFWPLLLVLGIADHFFLPDYDLRLPTLAVAGGAGWVAARAQRRKAERLELLDESS